MTASGQHKVTAEYFDHLRQPPNSFTSSTSTPLMVTVSDAGGGPSSGGGNSSASGTLKLGKPKTSGATLRVMATCAAGDPSCVDQYQVSVTEQLRNHRKVVVLGRARVTLAAGKSTRVKLTLNGAGKKLWPSTAR